jgi:hypothetical protein
LRVATRVGYDASMLTLFLTHLVLVSTPALAADVLPSPTTDASAAIDALHTQARAAEARGDTKGATKLWGKLDKAFLAAEADKQSVSDTARAQAAAHPLELLQASVQALGKVGWSDKGAPAARIKKNLTLVKERVDALPAIRQRGDDICRTYQDPEACAGATYLLASAHLGLADMIDAFELHLPADMDGDGEEYGQSDEAFHERVMETLRATFSPVASRADELLQAVAAMTAPRPDSVWGQRARDELARRATKQAAAASGAAVTQPASVAPAESSPAPWSAPAP